MNPIPMPTPPRPAPGRGPWHRSGPGGVLGRILLALGLWATLGAEAPGRVTLQLKWQHQFQFAGYYIAQAKGYYREAGLEVDILEARPGLDPIQEVLEGRAQYGINNSSLLLARQQGKPVVVLAAIFQHSPFVILARAESGIDSIHDLTGRRVMLERHSDELQAYLAKEGVSLRGMTLLEHSFNPTDLMTGKVDAISAYSTDEPFFLDQAGFQHLTFTPRTDGIDFYGDNLFTTEGEVRSHPDRVRAFREASMKGWKYAMQHPAEAADLILASYDKRHGRDYLLYEARQMVPLIQPDLVEMGYMHEGRWRHIAETYAELGLLARPYSLEGFIYDPGAPERLSHRRMERALTLVLPVAALLGAALLVFLGLNRRLRRALTAQADLAATLHENEQRFRFITEHAADVLWIVDIPSGQFTYVSPSVVQLRGYTPEEILARPMAEALTPESAALVQSVLAQAIASWHAGEPVTPRLLEVDQPHRDGHLVHTEVVTTLHADPSGRLVSVLGISRDITARRRTEDRLRQDFRSLEQLASTDTLTGVWNRRHFEEVVAGEMNRARRYGEPLSLLMLDIDHFKRVNDAHGHLEGDRVLRQIAECVRTVIRLSDSLTRWGGEEFIVLMPNTGLVSAGILAERVREAIEAHDFERVGQVTVSIGLADYAPSLSREAWLERADQALYRAKQGGRNRVEIAPSWAGKDPSEPPPEAFLKLLWRETYRSGHPLIDAQHEHLFHLGNDLLDAVLAGRSGEDTAALITDLITAVIDHFRDEERVLAELGFPGLTEHAAKHAELTTKALEQELAFRTGTLSVGSLFQYLAHDVVAQHMLKVDREFFHLTAGH